MSFEYAERSYSSLNEFIDRQRKSGLVREDGTPAYAYNMDRWILRALNSTPVKSIIQEAIHGIMDLQFGNLLSTGIPITERSFPEIYAVLAECSQTLGISIPYAIARSDEGFFNAYTAGAEGSAFVTVSTGILRFFTKDEVKFVIGHECGHIAAEHMAYKVAVDTLSRAVVPMLGPAGMALNAVAGLPLMAWSRRAEVTADRAGLLCVRDIEVAERALVRLVGGVADQQIDVDDFLRQSRTVQSRSSFAVLQNLMASHPIIPQRIEALRLFAQSKQYYALTGIQPESSKRLLSDAELARRTSSLVKP